jgi:putative membrane-bound dehydrogenase-like protein
MKHAPLALLLLASGALSLFGGKGEAGNEPAATGPQTEKRFPPLQVPPGFQATLFACDPLIEYPSVIARGPRPGTLLVAVDYMTGLGTEIVRRDEIRLLEDTDGDGYADRATVFAVGFNSIQGLACHDGTVFVMHAPYLTALRDTRGTGKADERRDLLTGLGLPPEKDQIRLHNANGVVPGHDGFLYLALGDRGCDVTRPEGDRLVLRGGGILRGRPDGRDLHVFARGLRNIYDVALDEELNVFVRDNENDGGDYKIRVCRSFFGADHGYPYLYYERPDEALPPLADLGLGSSAGGVCYLERQFPAEYRGNLFFCEWGRAVVCYGLRRAGASFLSPKEIDFAAGAPTDPYGFKPTDLVVDHDGSLLVSDWADGQRPRRGRGRIYRICWAGSGAGDKTPGPEQVLARLDSGSYQERCQAQGALERRGKEGLAAVAAALKKNQLGVRGQLHAVWILAKVGGTEAVEDLFALAKTDPDPGVQAQAIRALADLTDPVLVRHRLDAGRGDAATAARLASLADGRDPRVLLEVVLALGRLRWPEGPAWLRRNLKQPDPTLAHAAQQTLRRTDNWPAILKLLDEPTTETFRAIALRAVADQYDTEVVDGLVDRLRTESEASHRRAYADLLTRVWRKPVMEGYWGFRPPPRPANSVAWERTEAIEEALDRVLSDRAVRLEVLRRMLREKVPVRTPTLVRWLHNEDQPDGVTAILAALRDRPGSDSRPHLESVLRDRRHTNANRTLAADLFLQGLDPASEGRLLVMAEAVEDGPVLADLLRAIGKRRTRGAGPLLLRKLTSTDADVRAGAVGALAEVAVPEADEPIRKLLADPDARVRGAAALAAGKLALRPAVDQLLALARDPDAEVRRSSLEALRRLHEPRALAACIAALGDRETALQALECVGEMGGPDQARAVADVARRQPSVEILAAASKALTGWAAKDRLPSSGRQEVERALADLHGSGILLGWYVLGPVSGAEAADRVAKVVAGQSLPTGSDPAPGWRLLLASSADGRLPLGRATGTDAAWLAYSEIEVSDPARVEFFTASTGATTIWLNGQAAYRRDRPGVIGPYPDRFEAALAKGRNRLLVRVTGVKETADLLCRLRRKSAAPERERLALAALSRAGNPEAGRQIFFNAEKSLCIKCHRVGDKGERVGPELTGLGSRFAKAYIVESILEPSRAIAPSFETVVLALKNGKLVSGIAVAETEASIALVDSQGQKHVIPHRDVDERQKSATSTMPEGLEKRITEDEFVDLVSFLVNLKDARGR